MNLRFYQQQGLPSGFCVRFIGHLRLSSEYYSKARSLYCGVIIPYKSLSTVATLSKH